VDTGSRQENAIANRSLRGIATESNMKAASAALHAALLRPFSFVFEPNELLLSGGGSPPRGVFAVHHGTAAWTDLRAVPDHAGGDSLDVGDFMAA
jgi:hypothetical protein